MCHFIFILCSALAVWLICPDVCAQTTTTPYTELAQSGWPATDLIPRPGPSLAVAPTKGRATLSLALGMAQRPTRRDISASAVLTVPFPDWLGGAPSHDPGPELVRIGMELPSAPEPQKRLPKLRQQDVRAAVAASRRHASETAALERLDDLVNRARWSALLPELRLRATRLVDASASYAPTSYDAERTTSSGGISLWLEGRASWRLDRALFADEELRAEQQRRQLEQARRQLAQLTGKLLFGWLRAVYQARDPGLDSAQCLDGWIKEQEFAAELDLITGGWHQRWLARRKGLPQPWCLSEQGADESYRGPQPARAAAPSLPSQTAARGAPQPRVASAR